MNQLQKLFNYENQNVRVVVKDNEPWFVASDVCKILELSNTTMVMQRLDEDEWSKFNLGRQGEANIVNESGLYELIFASRKAEARTFKKWVKKEVLPAIRKTGQYSNVQVLDERTALIQSMKLTVETAERQDEIEKTLNETNQKLLEVEAKVEEQITLNSGEQRGFQKAVSRRVYEFTKDKAEASKLFRELYREIKDRFGIPSYKDLRRNELQSALNYVNNWIPKRVA